MRRFTDYAATANCFKACDHSSGVELKNLVNVFQVGC